MTRFLPASLARDVPASIVVFLVAMPLAMGIAIASGAPPEKGLLTGIIGGIVVGSLAGSPLQISGAAAGLAVLVFELIRDAGISALGPVLLLAGAVQLAAGVLRLGQWFRAISPAVVHGMLAGIGVLIVAGQLHVMLDAKPGASGLSNIITAPTAYLGLLPLDGSAAEAALVTGLVTILGMVAWDRFKPHTLRLVPGALVGVIAATVLAMAFAFPIAHVAVPADLWATVEPPSLSAMGMLLEPKIVLTAFALAFIASAETLLSAAAVDRMHDGVRTSYNRELSAQGVGNLLCGAVGALPMTGVIVRSSANVQAGAVTRLSAVLHGVWILAAIVLLPSVLQAIPMAALAGVLVVTGFRLVNLVHVRHLFDRYGPLPAAIWGVTFVTVVTRDLLTGVMVGIGLSLIELVPSIGRLRLVASAQRTESEDWSVTLAGTASLLRLPDLIKTLEAIPAARGITLRMRTLHFVDHTCAEFLTHWIERRRAAGETVTVEAPDTRQTQRIAAILQAA